MRGVAEVFHPDGELASALWRQAVHDLRGKLFVITNVTALLQRPASDARRTELIATLDHNVSGLRDLLDGVAHLARLDAKQEMPVVRTIDIATLLHEVCDSADVLASSRGLHLEFRGPPSLIAESDALMVERMAQNLMLNAIRYTSSRGVVLTCGACDDLATGNWYFDIRDAACTPADAMDNGVTRAPVVPGAAASPPGEGIGLSIVARLCHLLGGSMDIESGIAGRSTRIRLPGHRGAALDDLTRLAVPSSRSACTRACVQAGVEACKPRQGFAPADAGIQPPGAASEARLLAASDS